jgi:pilus assembly protein CpaD
MTRIVQAIPFTTPRAIVRLSLVLAISAATSACSLDDYTAADLGNPVRRHEIGFSPSPEALYVELAPGGGPLSANQEADVVRFIKKYKSESSGSLRIAAPRSARGHLAASQSLRQIENIVRGAGIDPSAVEATRYDGPRHIGPAVRLSYDRTDAIPPPCGDWSTDLGENRERLPYNDYGCATQRNLALTVANGRDLQQPKDLDPRSSERRGTTWKTYVEEKPKEVESGSAITGGK